MNAVSDRSRGNESRDPIIIIGSPRSGTTLVARLLELLGVFVGADLHAKVYEPRSFLRLNGWIYRECGATIFQPEGVRDVLGNPHGRDLVQRFLSNRIASSEFAGFMGRDLLRQYGSITGLGIPWGWKDPKTTFTLPSWLDVFPNSLVMHVFRHGVDVASSQIGFFGTSYDQMVSNYESSWRRSARLERQIRKRMRLPQTVRSEKRVCSSYLEGAFSTWHSYITEGARHVQALGERAMAVRYEDLLSDPQRVLPTLAEFCDLRPSARQLDLATRQITPTRAFTYVEDPTLTAFAERMARHLTPFGY